MWTRTLHLSVYLWKLLDMLWKRHKGATDIHRVKYRAPAQEPVGKWKHKMHYKKKKQYYMTILFLTSWWSTNYMQIINIFQTTTKNFNWNQTQWKTPTAKICLDGKRRLSCHESSLLTLHINKILLKHIGIQWTNMKFQTTEHWCLCYMYICVRVYV